jgi:hypothetical protein
VNLGELALTCFAYGAMTYDDSLSQFSRRVEGNTDLSNQEHRLALLPGVSRPGVGGAARVAPRVRRVSATEGEASVGSPRGHSGGVRGRL